MKPGDLYRIPTLHWIQILRLEVRTASSRAPLQYVLASSFVPLIDYAQLSIEDISIEREIYKGRGYRLHTAKMSGKIVVMKVYEGSRAREVGFTMTNHIHTNCFIEAVLGSRQVQLASSSQSAF